MTNIPAGAILPAVSFGDVLLYSLIVTGRVTVLLVFGVLAVVVLAHLLFLDRRAGSPAHRDPRSFTGAALSFLLAFVVPLCVKFGWGSVGPWVPRPLAATLAGLGTLACFTAVTFMGWAVLVLGRAAHVLARVDRGGRLVREPPFSLVRHPIYFGLGLLFAGSALAAVNWIAAAVAVAWWPVALQRARIEDQLLRKAFGAEFEDYARKVPGIWPRL
ncbi:MAG TPA: isoprenylcysteine carboxylmethyltransferase family protein [Candidatus Saccharimonadales bacterium]|nr:isoprenylcysteine carboxylmethyltransferase family protein [Candidatus Saccharimonadales bacterium]